MFNDAAVHVCVLYLVLGCTLAQITHPKSWLMAKTARSARIECVVGQNVKLTDTPIHWYQHREGDAFRRVLYIPAGLTVGKADEGFQDTLYPEGTECTKLSTGEKMFLGFGIILLSVFVVADAQRRLLQKTISVTATVGDTAVLTCEASGLNSGEYVHWYQKKDGEPFKRVLYINFGSHSKVLDPSHAQKDSFSTEKSNPPYDLRIDSVEMAHAATYYCACWGYDAGYAYKLFASGTKLIVLSTKETKPLKAPTVIAYPPSKPQNGKTTLLCVAMDMFPDIARFKWKEGNNDVAGPDKKVLEQKMESGTASMLIIDEINAESKHTCTVEHEGTTKGIQKEIPAGPIIEVDPGANSRVETEVPVCNGTQPKQIDLHRISDESFGLSRSLYLASLTYTLMILKSVGYFGVACLIMFKRSTNRPVKRI